MSVGELLKKTRKEKGYTLKVLSDKADISISFLSDIENGRSQPSLERLRDICKALDCTMSYILEEQVSEGMAIDNAYLDDNLVLAKELLKISGFAEILKEFKGFECWTFREKEELRSLLRSKNLYRNM